MSYVCVCKKCMKGVAKSQTLSILALGLDEKDLVRRTLFQQTPAQILAPISTNFAKNVQKQCINVFIVPSVLLDELLRTLTLLLVLVESSPSLLLIP